MVAKYLLEYLMWCDAVKHGLKLLVGASVSESHNSELNGGIFSDIHMYICMWPAKQNPGTSQIYKNWDKDWKSIYRCVIVQQWNNWCDRLLGSQILSEGPRSNIPYTKWRGLLNHLLALILWYSAASGGTRSKKKECVHLVRLYEWTRTFRS